jgi:TP901 family phage tail tape measure protein
MPADTFHIKTVFRAINRMTGPVNQMKHDIGSMVHFANRRLQSLQATTERMSNGMRRLSGNITKVGVVGGAGLGLIIGRGAEYERIMIGAGARIQGEVRKGTAEFDRMNKVVLGVAQTSEFTATEVAKMANELIKSGETLDQLGGTLPQVIDFATAADISAEMAGFAAPRILSATGLDVDDPVQRAANLSRALGVMTQVANTSKTTIDEMFFTIRDSGSVMTAAGQSVETFGTLIHGLTQAGIEGTKAGTALKRTMLALGAPDRRQRQWLNALKIDTADGTGKIRDVLDVMGDVRKQLDNFTQEQQLEIVRELFGLISLPGAITLLDQATGGLKDYRKTLDDASSGHTRMAQIIRSAFLINVKKFISVLEATAIDVFNQVVTSLDDIINRMSAWVLANKEWIATGIADVVKWLADNIKTLAKTIGGVFALTAAMMAFNLVVLTVSNTLLAAIAVHKAYVVTSGVLGNAIAWVQLQMWALSRTTLVQAVAFKALGLITATYSAVLVGVGTLVNATTSAFTRMGAAILWVARATKLAALGSLLLAPLIALKGMLIGLYASHMPILLVGLTALKGVLVSVATGIGAVTLAILASPFTWLLLILGAIVGTIITLNGGWDSFIDKMRTALSIFTSSGFQDAMYGLGVAVGLGPETGAASNAEIEAQRQRMRQPAPIAPASVSATSHVVVEAAGGTTVTEQKRSVSGSGATVSVPVTGGL